MPYTAVRRRPARALAARLVAALTVAGAGACGGRTLDPIADPGTRAEAVVVREAARPITGAAGDYDPILALVDAGTRLVLVGDATHGTHEFYAERARLTQRLVTDRGFTAVAIESDWADAARVNAYVRGVGTDRSAEEALSAFRDFPDWMWRNVEMRDFVQWLRTHNAARPPAQRVGVYGIDVQDLFGPIAPVLAHLDATDPAAAARVRSHYACLETHRPAPERYGLAVRGGASCEAGARAAVTEVERLAGTRPADPAAAEAQFGAVRAAHAVANAEAYFRATYLGTTNTWNLRDSLMDRTLDAVVQHLGTTTGATARAAVWAHNSHVGDARHTQMGTEGELNIGQLSRQRYGDAALLVGFLTYRGTVYAAREWGATGQVRTVTPALPGSYAALFHATELPAFVLPIRGSAAVAERLAGPRLERAIGVIYRPETERASHYFTARLASQFDAVAFFDVTRAVTPLPASAAVASGRRGAGRAASRAASRDR